MINKCLVKQADQYLHVPLDEEFSETVSRPVVHSACVSLQRLTACICAFHLTQYRLKLVQLVFAQLLFIMNLAFVQPAYLVDARWTQVWTRLQSFDDLLIMCGIVSKTDL